MIFIYNQAEKTGVQYKESRGKGTLNLLVGGESIVIGTSKDSDIKNVLLQKAADKKTIANRLKRIFLSVKGKRLVLDVDNNEFKFIDSDKKEEKFNFAQNVIYLVCNGEVTVSTKESNFVKAPEYTRLQKEDVTVIKLLPRWRAWYAMKEEVVLDIINKEGNKINSFELGWVEDDNKVKSNALRYRHVEPMKKEKTQDTPKKPFNKKPFNKDGKSGKPNFGTKKDFKKPSKSEAVDFEDRSRTKYPAKKSKKTK